MYGFILSMYVAGRITADRVQTYAPKFITHEEADLIVSTPLLTEQS